MKKVLIRVPNWIGDSIISLSFIDILIKSGKYDDPFILVKEYVSPIFEHFRKIIIFKSRKELFLKSVKLRREKIDVGFVLPHSFSSALSLYLTGTAIRIGYNTEKRSSFLTHLIELPEDWRRKHILKNFLRLLDVVKIDKIEVTPHLPLKEEEIKEAMIILKKIGVESHKFIAYAPFTAYGPAKEWGIEKFYRLALKLKNKGLPGVILGGKGDLNRSKIFNGIEGIHNLTGKLNLKEAASILSLAGVLVTNDSGLSHLSSSVGTPTLVIFGSTSPLWSKPLGNKTFILYKANSLPCSPCFKRKCPFSHKKCMEKVEIEEVERSVYEILEF